jgi:hypothetical protein
MISRGTEVWVLSDKSIIHGRVLELWDNHTTVHTYDIEPLIDVLETRRQKLIVSETDIYLSLVDAAIAVIKKG